MHIPTKYHGCRQSFHRALGPRKEKTWASEPRILLTNCLEGNLAKTMRRIAILDV